jgi:uncharacterized protein YaiE (UPF0345 family)
MLPRYVPPQAAVVRNNASAGTNSNSTILQIFNCSFVSAFGNVNGPTTITLMYSFDGQNFHAGPSTTLAGASAFHIDATTGAQVLCHPSSSSVTTTAVISAK